MTCYKRVQGEHKRGAGWKVRRIRDSWLQTHRLESPQVKLGVINSLATGHVSRLVLAVYFPCSQHRKHCISVFAATSSSVHPSLQQGGKLSCPVPPFLLRAGAHRVLSSSYLLGTVPHPSSRQYLLRLPAGQKPPFQPQPWSWSPALRVCLSDV